MRRSTTPGRLATLAALLVVLILSACNVEKSDSPDPVRVGSKLTYTIRFSIIPSSPDAQTPQSDEDRLIEPSGIQDGYFLRVVDVLPPSVEFVSVEPDENCEHAGGVVTCEFEMQEEPVPDITIVVRPTRRGLICNTATLFLFFDGRGGVAPQGGGGGETEIRELGSDEECTTVVDRDEKPNGKPGTDDDEDQDERLTEEQQRQKEKTNQRGLGDYSSEGIVVGYRAAGGELVLAPWLTLDPHNVPFNLDDPTPYILIATLDGIQQVRLFGNAVYLIGSVRIDDYLEAEGDKMHEHLFDAYDAGVRRT